MKTKLVTFDQLADGCRSRGLRGNVCWHTQNATPENDPGDCTEATCPTWSALPDAEPERVCRWTPKLTGPKRRERVYYWSTSCDEHFMAWPSETQPDLGSMKYCPYCGGKIEEVTE